MISILSLIFLLGIYKGDSRGCNLIYNGSCYRAFEVSDGINWLDAQSSCAVWGGDLTSITTEIENNLLYTAISDTVNNSWIGLYERDGDGVYQWVDGTALSYTNWTGSAPTAGSTTDCVQMNTIGAGDWIAADCEGTSNSFICKKPSTSADTIGGRFGGLINGGKAFQELSGSTFFFNSSLTLVCGGEENSSAIQWKYSQRSDLSSSQLLTATYASTETGLSWITINNTQQGLYRCVINSSLSYTIGLYDQSSTAVEVMNFASPSQQVDYTVGSTNSLLYYSDANIPDSSLRWTTETVTNGTDTQYSIEYENPVLLSTVFSDMGAGVQIFSCFYRTSPVTLVGSLQLAIRDIAAISISYAGYDNTFSDVNNMMFPSPQRIPIPEGTRDVILTCNLTQCMWMIQLKNRNYKEMSPYNISVFDEEKEGTYSLIRETNSGKQYTTAHVYIYVQLNPASQPPSIPFVPIAIIIIAIVIALTVIIPIICIIAVKKRKRSTNGFLHKRTKTSQSNEMSREGTSGYANQAEIQSPANEYINMSVNPNVAVYMTIDETFLIPLENEHNTQGSYYSDLAFITSNEDSYQTVEGDKEYFEINKSEHYGNCSSISAIKETKKFVVKYVPTKDFPVTYQQYVTSGMGKDSLFSVEFQALNEESKKYDALSDDARREQNMRKNPNNSILPYDESRVVLDSPYFDCNYINASWLENSQFIASIHPTIDTLQEFLQMIYQTEASMVIMLTTRKEKAKILGGVSNRVCYWPKKDEPLMCAPFITSLISSTESTAFVKQEISLKNTLEGKKHSYTLCISPIWNEDGTVVEMACVMTLLTRIMKQKQDSSNMPIIIHCADGISKTGIIMTALNLIQKFNPRKSINIFNTVKNLRKQRMNMIPTLACYTTCYSLMNEYCSIHL